MKKLVTLILVMISLNISAQSRAEKKAAKKQEQQEQYEKLKTIVESGSYEYEALWANPMGAPRINLATNPNYLRYQKDSMDIFFPYFGVSQTVNTYNTRDIGINFSGAPQNYKVSYDDEKMRITIKFSGRSETESLDFIIVIYGESSAKVSINSSGRQSISYDGKLEEYEKE